MTATTVEAFGAGTAIRIGATTGTLTLRNPTIVGSETTQSLFNTVATTVNAFGAAETSTWVSVFLAAVEIVTSISLVMTLFVLVTLTLMVEKFYHLKIHLISD